MVTFLLNAFKIILMLGFLVFIHEAGHFLVAKLFKIQVNEFALGFGPTILKKKRHGTKYALRLIPLGGFVSLEGEEEHSDKEGSFSNTSIRKKIMIISAGAIVNILFGMFIYFILTSTAGNFYSTKVDYTIKNYAAEEYGILNGDIITKVNDKEVKTKNDVKQILSQNGDNTVKLNILRNKNEIIINLKPTAIKEDINEEHKIAYFIGVVFEKIENNIGNNIYYGLIDTKDFFVSILANLKQVFSGKVMVNQMVGVVGISDIVVKTQGIYEYVYIIALISLSLGITNLIPLPPLDGGKILIYIIEAIRRKPMKEENELKIQTWGFTILIALSIYVTYNDVLRIF